MAERQCIGEKRGSAVQQVIGLLKKLKDVVMLSPIDADHHKAENIGEIGWPEIEEHDQQTAGALARNLNIQNEQRDGDGEHAVAKGLDPIRFAFGTARLGLAHVVSGNVVGTSCSPASA